MSKKDKIKTIEVDDVNLVPELLDGNHRVIPIVTGGDEPVEEGEVPEIIPILTLRSSVLFPGAITPITVGRDKSINLVRAVNAEGGILGAVLQRESDVEDPAPDDMYKVGTAARIIKILEMPNGNLTVILNGLEKVEITEYITTEPYFKARVTALRDSTPDVKSIEFEALVDSIRDVALNIINVSPSMPKEAAFAIKNIDSKRGIINFICSNMELTDEDRQSLLEAPGLLARARNPDPRAAAGRAEEPDSGARQAGDRQAAARLLPPAADAYDPGRTGRRRRCRHREDARGGQEEELARGGGRNLREGVAEGRAAESRRGRIFGADDLPAAAAGTAVERRDEGQPRPQVRPRTARSRPFRSGRGEGAAAGAPGRHQAQGRPQIADPLPLRPSGRG